jgi:hypothetical protein
MATELENQLIDLFKGAAGNTLASFTADDRTDLETYGGAIARLVIQRKGTSDPTEIADIDRQVGNFKTAIALMVDKYVLKAQDAGSKAALAGLKLVATKAFELLVAAAIA